MATADSQAMRQHILDQFQSLEDITATLCRGQALFSAEADRLNAVNSTNMAPEGAIAAVGEASPERVPGKDAQRDNGDPAILFGPAAINHQPVEDVFVRAAVPDDGGVDLDEGDGGDAVANAKAQATGKISVGNRESIMAMVRVSRAQSALQTQMEVEAA